MGMAFGYSSNFEVNDLDSVRELHCHSKTRSRRTANASEITFPARTSIHFYHMVQGTVG